MATTQHNPPRSVKRSDCPRGKRVQPYRPISALQILANPLRVFAFIQRRGKRGDAAEHTSKEPPALQDAPGGPGPSNGSNRVDVEATALVEGPDPPEPRPLEQVTPTGREESESEAVPPVESAVAIPDVDVAVSVDFTVGPGVIDIGTLEATSQVVFSALRELQNVHPYVKILLLPVQVAINMEITRRENDAKIVALKYRMLDMLEVLRDLPTPSSREKVCPGLGPFISQRKKASGAHIKAKLHCEM